MLIPENCCVPTVVPREQEGQLQKRRGRPEAHARGKDGVHSFRGTEWLETQCLISISDQWNSRAHRGPHQLLVWQLLMYMIIVTCLVLSKPLCFWSPPTPCPSLFQGGDSQLGSHWNSKAGYLRFSQLSELRQPMQLWPLLLQPRDPC